MQTYSAYIVFFFFKWNCKSNYSLFANVPWPGGRKGFFGLLVKLPPLHLSTAHGRSFEVSFCRFDCWILSREATNSNFYSLWSNTTGNRARVYRFNRGRTLYQLDRRMVLDHVWLLCWRYGMEWNENFGMKYGKCQNGIKWKILRREEKTIFYTFIPIP